MTQPAKAQEPSMEEILASIRRIIADDDASKAAQRPPEPPKPPVPPAPQPSPPMRAAVAPPPERPPDQVETGGAGLEDQASEILELTESMAAPAFGRAEPAANAFPMPNPPPQFRKIEGVSDVSFDEVEQKPAMQRAAQMPSQAGEHGPLISSATSAAVDSAFNTLAQTVLANNARTLEDLVREMLRPMLKSWLDDNLPGMVERLVRAEIERVARGR
ncbi:MAG TPA: DUF2497 domain-containing protein [Xanthobacteraceae bacterium]|nr:DUF2497 domain-containing protein [Xanthobacteraceae bacterium]